MKKLILLLFLLPFGLLAQNTAEQDTTAYIAIGANGHPASFAGDGLKSYIQKNICPSIKGTKFITAWAMTIEKDGSYGKIINTLNSGASKEQLQTIDAALNAMPNWKPADINGVAVRYRFTFAVRTPDSCLPNIDMK